MKKKRLLALLLAVAMALPNTLSVGAVSVDSGSQQVEESSKTSDEADEEAAGENSQEGESAQSGDVQEGDSSGSDASAQENSAQEDEGGTEEDSGSIGTDENADGAGTDGNGTASGEDADASGEAGLDAETDEAAEAAETGASATTVGSSVSASDDGVITYSEDFEGNDASNLWGFTGDMLDDEENIMLALATEEDGNTYLTLAGENQSQKTAVKTFKNVQALSSAEFSYDIYVTSSTTDTRVGRPGIQLMSSGIEVISVYTGEARTGATSAAVYYSVYGSGFVSAGVSVPVGSWANIMVQIDYETLTAAILVNGETAVTVAVSEAAYALDSVVINMASTNSLATSKAYTAIIGYDNFSFKYVASGEEAPRIVTSVVDIGEIDVTKEEWDAGYTHPETVTVNLTDGTTAALAVTGWTVSSEMDLTDSGTYTWTGTLVTADDITNPLGITVSYTMNYIVTFEDSDIYTLAELDEVTLTLEMWEAGYEHPDKVTATLADGSTITVEIDTDTWETENFDQTDAGNNAVGVYTWTADIIVPDGNANPRGLKATYVMNWWGDYVTTHDYENEFTFEIWESIAFGKDVDSTSGTGGFTLTQEQEEDGNYYMKATVTGKGDRGSRLELYSGVIQSASVQFDWMPMAANSDAYGAQVLFMAPDSRNSYFSLIFDSSLELYYYTECNLPNTSTVQSGFKNSISYEDKVDTGLAGDGSTWFTVNLEFDYINHTADLTITNKTTGASYTAAGIAIDTSANGLELLVIHMSKKGSSSSVTMGLDNMYIDYTQIEVELGEKDIMSVINPDDVMLTREQYEVFEWPTEVEVTLGDGSTAMVSVGEWFCEKFDPDAEYQVFSWTAELITDEYNNYFNLTASFAMTYMQIPYVTYAPNPNTLELEYGTAWSEDELPTTVKAYLSDGSTYQIPVSEWTAIRAFDSENEGIYVYGANLEAVEGEVSIYSKLLTSNEYHVSGDDYTLYKYNVYYRISYYETTDSYYDTYTYSSERLDRDVYAVMSESGEGILVSWRLQADEYSTDVEFYVYRNGEQVNEEPITDVTNYLDTEGSVGDVYTVKTVQDGCYWISDAYIATEENYISISLQNPGPQPDKDGNLAEYTINDCGTADVDGDGELELIVKWYPDDAFDPGKGASPSSPTIFDIYEMDGTPLWRLNMGLDIPSGAHWNQFILYDLDEDGRAELFIKTSDGTTSYRPNEDGLFDMTDESTIVSVIGDPEMAGTHIKGNGKVTSDSNEWMTVFDGETGEVIDSIDYIYETVNSTDYGDGGYNRSSRYNIAVAYQPVDRTDESRGTIPTVLYNHGYYSKTTVAAYTLRTAEDGTKYLQLEWGFDSVEYTGESYGGRGNHNIATGDVDNDGFDELVIGALCLDHDGNVLWVKDGSDGQDVAGHSDALSLAAMNPDDPTQLYVFTPMEDSSKATVTGNLSNAGTGTRINGMWYGTTDYGRGLAANITPTPGYEYWVSIPNNEGIFDGGIYNFTEGLLVETMPEGMVTNWIAYWDGDLLSELPDAVDPSTGNGTLTIYKYNWETNSLDTLQTMEGTLLNNSTKNNPSLTADLMGDWREEIVVRGEDNETLYIYMSNYETDYGIYSLMYDPVYRNAVANQNTSYNQPPHLGFYLGEDNADQVLAMELPVANLSYTTEKEEGTPVEEETTPDEGGSTTDGDTLDTDTTVTNADSEAWAPTVESVGSGNPVIYVPDGYDSIPDWVMNSLDPDTDYTFIFPDGTEITIPAGEAPDSDDGIEWYGPEWLKEHYGADPTDADPGTDPDATTIDGTATDSAATGDSMSTSLIVFVVILVAAAAGLAAVLVIKKRGQQSR